MSGSYFLVSMGALNEIILGNLCLGSGSTWELVRVRPDIFGGGLGGCRNIPSHPVQQESLKKEEFVPRGGGSMSSESHNWDWELWAYVAC